MERSRGSGRPPMGWSVPSEQVQVVELAIDTEEDAGNLPHAVAARLRVVVEPLGDQIALMLERQKEAGRLMQAPATLVVVPYPAPQEAA